MPWFCVQVDVGQWRQGCTRCVGAWQVFKSPSRGHGAALGPMIAAPMLRSLFLTHLCAHSLVSCRARAYQNVKTSPLMTRFRDVQQAIIVATV